MFIALLGTVITAFADVFWKKSLVFSLHPLSHNLASFPIALFLTAILLFFKNISFEEINMLFLIGVIATVILNILKQPISQKIYKEEKISVILPYSNLHKIFVVIFSFFVFHDVSYIAFYITLLAIIIIALFSIDFKTYRLPRNLLFIISNEIISAVMIITSGSIVLYYGAELFFSFNAILGCILYIIAVYAIGRFGEIRHTPIQYWKIRGIGSLGWLSGFLGLIVIESLGLSLSILLGFLGIFTTLIVSYFFLGDTPSRKNILLTVTVSVLIGIGYYFK